MFHILIAMFSLALIITSTALAEGSLPPEFLSCSRIQKNGERLACYDQAVAYLSRPAEQQAAAPSAEASFGLQAGASQAPVASAMEGANADEISSITARVTEVTADREGKKVISLDNGQTWRELNKSSFVSLEAGDEVTINRASLGSFMMSVPNGRPLRVRRVK